MTSSACSDAPTKPSVRLFSISLLAISRTCCTARHLSINAELLEARSVKVSKKIDSDLPNVAHASSAVKLRNGDIQRSMAWVIWCRAVCALRRARDFGAVVYRRSLSTSK